MYMHDLINYLHMYKYIHIRNLNVYTIHFHKPLDFLFPILYPLRQIIAMIIAN